MRSRLRYVLFVSLLPLVGLGGVNPGPLVVAACLFVLHGFLSVVTRADERSTVRDLVSAVLLRASPKPFVWTKTADQILGKIAGFGQATLEAHGAD